MQEAPAGTGSLADMARLIDRQPRRFPPGARHGYSNANYTLLALVAERSGGASFDALQRRRLFAPLGLSGIGECAAMDRADSHPGTSADGAPRVPAAQPAPDLCRQWRTLRQRHRACPLDPSARLGEAVGGRLLREMARSRRVEAGYIPPYGFGLSLKPLLGRPAFWHAGVDDGWGAYAAYLPSERLTLVVLADRGWLWTTDVALPILRALARRAGPEAARAPCPDRRRTRSPERRI